MARKGEVLENPVTGERVTFLATTEETDGRLLRAEVRVRAHAFSTGKVVHVHARQEERFDMREGHLMFRVDGIDRRAGPGDIVVVQPRHRHAFWNADDEPATFILEVEPALAFETILETVFGLARDGKTSKNGMPNLLQLGVIASVADGYGNPLERAVIGILAFLGRLAGYRARYDRYSGPS